VIRHRSTSGWLALLGTVLMAYSSAFTDAAAQTSGGETGTRPGLSPSRKERAGGIDRSRERALEEQRRYKGTQVRPDPKATGIALALQLRIASLLDAQDFVPEPRKVSFRWMYESEHTPVTGWNGRILDVTPDRDGMVVTVEFRVRPTGFCTSATSTERYRLSHGRLRFLDLVYKGGVSTWN
jgi:hypothetical protein